MLSLNPMVKQVDLYITNSILCKHSWESDFHFASQYLVIAHLLYTQQHEHPERCHTTTNENKQILRQ